MGFTITKPYLNSSIQITKPDLKPFSITLRRCSSPRRLDFRWSAAVPGQEKFKQSECFATLPLIDGLHDWPLMAVLVQHMEGQRELVTYKSIWYLSDRATKNIYVFYMFFTCWGCLFFGSMKQENTEESARTELWGEELIEEIEQKVESSHEHEEASCK